LGSIRPSEEDEVKSNFIVDTDTGTEAELFGNTGDGSPTNEQQDLSTIDIELNNGQAQRCFVGTAGNSNVNSGIQIKQGGVVYDWFTNGVWDICDGENDTCEIKVVRRNEVIQQIHSKCANRHSCVDNMRQNFNPQIDDSTQAIYSSWVHQACRPAFANNWNARQQQRDSVCFFCVEPCRDSTVWNAATTANAMKEAECVGRGGTQAATSTTVYPVWNASPIRGNTAGSGFEFKLFNDCSDAAETDPTDAADAFEACTATIDSDHGQTTWVTDAPTGTPNMKLLNFYSVKADVSLYNTEIDSNHPLSLVQDVSQIQYAQIQARADNALDTSK